MECPFIIKCNVHFYTALRCNGRRDLCKLRFDQVTFPGSHSSGSGSNGELRNCEGEEGGSCLFRNQLLSITGQLNLGIRFLSLDICHLPTACNDEGYGLYASRLVSCQRVGSRLRYGDSVLDIFNQVEDWMKLNTKEVIGLHFTKNTPYNERLQVFRGLIRLLDVVWRHNSSTTLNSFYTIDRSWPTLKQAVESNQRIFVFFDEELMVRNIKRPWINPPPFSTFQETSTPLNPNCMIPGILDHALRCDTPNDIVIATGYTVAMCITDAQAACNKILLDAMEICYDIRRKRSRTVNVILVDYATKHVPVFYIAMIFNQRNIRSTADISLKIATCKIFIVSHIMILFLS